MDPSSTPPRQRRPNRKSLQRTTERWNDADYSALLSRAERAGLSVASYIRACALGAPTTRARHRAPVDLAALAAVLRAFAKVAVNIDQIARHLNTGGFVQPEELARAGQRIDASRAEVMRIVRPR